MNSSDQDNSPFHSGEKALQTRMGVRERMEQFGRAVIRDHMPEQHREFYRQLPFIFVGHADQEGWPWASILFNAPGFISSPHERSLRIDATPITGDPLSESIEQGLKLGLLGIELPSRRRNRLAARVTSIENNILELEVDQSFGNCPQYIQTRALKRLDSDTLPKPEVHVLRAFDENTKTLINQSDTFFVASYADDGSQAAHQGADVSHRGGRPGFIRIDDELTLTIPDYIGNNHFNTLGNFVKNNKAGLLFMDFENGHLLTLTGTTEILWESPETENFDGADRLWTFKLEHGRYIKHALPLRWTLKEFSPNSVLTGTWKEAKARSEADQRRDEWRPYVVRKIEQESQSIVSFYLEAEGHEALPFKPGQFISLKASIEGKEHLRTYSLSSAPADRYFRVSVKREPSGVFSNYLHSEINVGDSIIAQAPKGSFTFDTDLERPALLLGAGVGITPLIAMARHALIEGLRIRRTRPITFIGSVQNKDQRAFFEEFKEIASASLNQIQVYWAISQDSAGLELGTDFHHKGRINKALLQAILPLDDYDVYLCGPDGFMQSAYDMMRSLGVSDSRIHAEAFGPSSLRREADSASEIFETAPIAQNAIVDFVDSGFQQAWTDQDGTLLEFAESHGLNPESACRSGQCGACKTELVSGKVSYQTAPAIPLSDHEILLCCSMPADDSKEDLPTLSLML